MAVVGNRFYNNPSIGQAIGSLAQLFAPPSPQDMTAAATTAATAEKAKRLADFYRQSQDPNTSWETLDRSGIGAGLITPNQSFRAVDIGAATSRGNNAADNARALQQTELDNARALEDRRLQESGAYDRKKLDPYAVKSGEMVFSSPEAQAVYGVGPQVSNNYAADSAAATSRDNNAADNARALMQTDKQQVGDTERALLAPVGPGATRFVPSSIGGMYDLPPEQIGVVSVNPGDRATLPDGRMLEGADKPLSETEWKAQQSERLRAGGQLTDADLKNTIMGSTPVESIVGPDGKPQIAYRPQAVGQQPAPKEVDPSSLGKLQAERAALPPGDPRIAEYDAAITAAGKAGGVTINMPSETGARIGLGDQFLQGDLPAIQSALDNGVFDGPMARLNMAMNRGEQGAVILRMKTGIEALIRNLTGAGKSQTEAEDYASQYLPSVDDGSERIRLKLNGLVANLRGVREGAIAAKTGGLASDGTAPVDVLGAGNAPAQAAAPAQPAAAGVPNFEQMGGTELRAWVEANPEAVKNLPDAEFQRLRARAQQLQGPQ